MQSPSTATVGDYARMVRRHALVLLAAVVLGVGAGYLAHLMQPAHYVSQARTIVTVPGPATVYAARATDLGGRLRADSFSDMATSPILLQRVIATGADVGAAPTVDELRSRVTASTFVDSAVVRIDATGDTAQTSAALASAVATQLKQLVQEVDETRDSGPLFDMTIIDAASAPVKVSQTSWTTAVGLGGGIGLGVGALGVLGADLVRNRVRDSRDVVHSLRDVGAA